MAEALSRRRALRLFGKKLGLKSVAAGDCKLLNVALTHDSYASETGAAAPSNERLEFLGDAIIGAAVAVALYERHPDKSEGKLSPLRAALVSKTALAQTAQRLQLAPLLQLGKGERAGGGAERPSILASALEAVVGAIYFCDGFDAACKFVEAQHLAHFKPVETADPKTALQEYAQARFKQAPRYTVTAQSGPPHQRTFDVTVAIRGEVMGAGSGATKKQAETAAARQALQKVLPAGRM